MAATTTREPLRVGGHRIFVPATEELKRLLRNFGRPKDLKRAKLLDE